MDQVVVASLVGVLLGSATALASQYVTIRAARKESLARRLDLRRDELRVAIREFVESAQDGEEWAIYRYEEGRPPDGASTHNLWLTQKLIDIVAPGELSKAALDYANVLNELVWVGGIHSDWNDFAGKMTAVRKPFLNAASRALGGSQVVDTCLPLK